MAQAKLNAALLEKEQLCSDLNAMERSLGELFKRLEKYKDIIEGYKKVSSWKPDKCLLEFQIIIIIFLNVKV